MLISEEGWRVRRCWPDGGDGSPYGPTADAIALADVGARRPQCEEKRADCRLREAKHDAAVIS
jgi:hypothetical protein